MARRVQTREASGALVARCCGVGFAFGDRFGTELNEMTQDVGAVSPGYSAAAASMAWAMSSVSVSRWRGRTVGIAQVYHQLQRCNTGFGWRGASGAMS